MPIRSLINILSISIALLFLTASPFARATDLDAGIDAYLAADYPSAMKILHPLAQPADETSPGDPIAQYLVAEMHYYGQGVPLSFLDALNWYQLSAGQGDLDAEYSLGFMYENAEGVPQDLEQAQKWYLRAASQGHAAAQHSLGQLYLLGLGTEPNPSEGIKWMQSAADNNDIEAQFELGFLHEQGDVVALDLNEAIKWYQFAVNQGHLAALEGINRIRARDDFKEDYVSLLRRLGLTRSDADALLCENLLWTTAIGLRLEGNEAADRRLEKFADQAISRVGEFRAELAKKLEQERYSEDPTYQALVVLLQEKDQMYRDSIQVLAPAGSRIPLEDRLILERDDGGIFELAYAQSFIDYFDSLSGEETRVLWDQCTSNYIPSLWNKPDIGLRQLDGALNYQPISGRVLDYGTNVSDWSRTTYQKARSIDVCDGDLDLPGGIAIGTAATSLAAGESVLVIITASGALVASAPAIATGVTATAIAGATVYAVARGYCYFFKESPDEDSAGSLDGS